MMHLLNQLQVYLKRKQRLKTKEEKRKLVKMPVAIQKKMYGDWLF